MAYYKLAYNKQQFLENGNQKPPRGVEIRRDIPILESKAVNDRRRAERQQFGITKPKESFDIEVAVNDPRYYREQLGDISEKNLGWDDF